ncbi:MAG: hypothetical protein HGB21_17080, partial [Nitrospirae bacterium]|nr:hypothetical protein [Nitrospirota bacterium]
MRLPHRVSILPALCLALLVGTSAVVAQDGSAVGLRPVEDPLFGKRYVRMPAQVDDATLQRIAEITGGRYFRATDAQALDRIFSEIDQLE